MRKLNFSGTYYGETITLEQVQKRTAKKLFNSGETVYIQSSNFHPFGVWSQCMDVSNKTGESFETILNNFKYYICNNEAGRYVTFYKRIK